MSHERTQRVNTTCTSGVHGEYTRFPEPNERRISSSNLLWTYQYKVMGLLLTYGLATRHACYAPATRPLLAVDLHVWFSQDEEVFTQQVK